MWWAKDKEENYDKCWLLFLDRVHVIIVEKVERDRSVGSVVVEMCLMADITSTSFGWKE